MTRSGVLAVIWCGRRFCVRESCYADEVFSGFALLDAWRRNFAAGVRGDWSGN